MPQPVSPLFDDGPRFEGVIKAGFAALFAPCAVSHTPKVQASRKTAMDLKLKPFDFDQAVARAGLRRDGTPLLKLGAEAPAVQAPSFANAMTQALTQVSAQQMDAQRLQREVALDNPTVSLEQTMMAMQKAQIGFQATLAVRNRLVQAYTDIMNMTV